MTFDGAVVTQQGVKFGIVIVKRSVLGDQAEVNRLIASFQQMLRVAPVVLMGQDSRGVPSYCGRDDIVRFLASIDMRRIPWRTYTVR